MQQNHKYITTVLIVLCCAINVSAWDDETGLAGNETLNYGENSIFNESELNDPYRYMDDEIVILNPTIRSNHNARMCTSYRIYKHEWDSTTSTYVKNPNCFYEVDECVDMQYKVDFNSEGYWAFPDNFESQVSDGYLVKRYFQSMLNSGNIACAEYENMDEVEKPDIFEINASADVGNTSLNKVFTGYVTFDADTEKQMKKNQDYGFNVDSVCGEGGSGALANQIGWGTMDETSKSHKKSFEVFFYTIIPIIFVLLVMKMMGKVSH